MKLSELINSVSLKAREVTNFISYPVGNISRIVQGRLQLEYEKLEFPDGNNTKKQLVEESQTKVTANSNIENKINSEFNSSSNRVVYQKLDLLSSAKINNKVEIKPLQKNDEIRGRRGRYRVDSDSFIQKLDKSRIYQGIQVTNNKPVLIKEFLLPEADFNQKEARKCREEFEELASVNLKNAGGQDFRLMTPWDAIAPRDERRCYLITEPIENSITLKEYIEQTNRSMASQQVRELLKQVLQTLWFLHNQRVRLPNGEVLYGLPHGNLSLDSILIVFNEQKSLVETPQLLIYLSDLALWEDLFKPRNGTVNHSVAKDLNDLGYISFYLLLGGSKDLIFGQSINPRDEQHWSTVDDIFLKSFIQSLLGINPPFTNAEQARQALLAIPYSQVTIEQQAEKEIEENQKEYSKNLTILRIVLISFAMVFLGLLFIWPLIAKYFMQISPDSPVTYSQIKDVKDLPNGNYIYTAAKSEETWDSLMYYTSKNKRIKRTSLVSFGKTFEEELRERGMKLKLNYQPTLTIDDAFIKLKDKKTDFLIVNLVGNFANELKARNFKYETIGYDGIVIFVPFSDSQRKGSISEALNGKISFDQLRKLYTRKITSWDQLDKRLPKLQVKLYIPNEETAINQFKKVVFKNYPEEVKRFEELILTGQIIKQETRETLGKQILGDFENGLNAGIGFGLLSKVFGQCSVYPLSVGEQGQEVQTLVQNDGNDIDPKTDLCNDKGSYRPNIELFTQKVYSLGYEIAVVYPNLSQGSKIAIAGSKFAEMLKTDEGQDLISEAGLIPEKRRNSN